MVTEEEAENAVLALIEGAAEARSLQQALTALLCAEALAWIVNPSQPHGAPGRHQLQLVDTKSD